MENGLQQAPNKIEGSIPDRTRSAAGKRSRASNAKVRTGCGTCKIRRVKCDETKPHCLRCIKYGVDCNGYTPLKAAPSRKKPIVPIRVLLPKASTSGITAYHKLPILRMRTGPRFENEQEARYFRIYCEDVSTQIQGPFKSSLWDRLIPQISEGEPFILHAVIAIGAVGKITQRKRSPGAITSMRTAQDCSFALHQFDKALVGMQRAISSGENDMRKAMISCILIFCFETLIGKPASALNNAESGLMLLYQWLYGNADPGPAVCVGAARQRHKIEEVIMDGLAGLDTHVLFFLDKRPVHVHEFMVDAAKEPIADMPLTFESLKQARCFWSLIMRRNIHFIKIALVLGKSDLSGGNWNYEDENDGVNIGPGGTIFSTPAEPVLEMIPDSVHYREDNTHWVHASASVFRHIGKNGSEEEKVVCALLQVHQIMNEIMLQGIFFVAESSYDILLPEFRKMMVLFNYVHPHVATSAPNDTLYHFDLGIIAPLYFVGLRCRDRQVRDNVIELLSKVHYREGMWDSLATLKFVEWMKELEDPVRDQTGFVPDNMRAVVTSALVDLEAKRAIIHATQRTGVRRVYLEKRVCWL